MTMKTFRTVLLATMFVCLFVTLAEAKKLATIRISGGANEIVNVTAEIANTPEERALGLMFRKELAEDHGMWFIFDQDTKQPFWMKNTPISLDIIFVNNSMEIESITEKAKPMSEALIRPKDKYRFVLEVPAGFAKKHRLRKGHKIRMMTSN